MTDCDQHNFGGAGVCVKCGISVGDEIDRLHARLDAEEERVRYYRNEWENACEREQGLKHDPDVAYDACIKLTQKITDAILRAEAAEAKLARYRMALEWYEMAIVHDRGNKARAALAEDGGFLEERDRIQAKRDKFDAENVRMMHAILEENQRLKTALEEIRKLIEGIII